MAKQKVPPDPGALDRQDRGQRHRCSLVLAVAVALLSASCGSGGSDHVSDTPTASIPSGTPATTPPSTLGLFAVDISTAEATLFLEVPEGGTEVAIAPKADLIAFEAEDGDARPQIFVMNADGTDQRQLTHEPLAARLPAWSPDGARIAYVGQSQDLTSEIYVVDVASGASHRITWEPRTVEGAPAWFPDGEKIAYQVDQPPVVRSIDIATGNIASIVGDAGIPDVSPDGSRIAFNTWSSVNVTLARIDGSDRTIIETDGEVYNANWSPNGKLIAFQSYPMRDITVYELTTGERRAAGSGDIVDWLDDQTLLVLM